MIKLDLESRDSISGMSCAGCVSTVEGALKGVPAVRTALVTGKARARN